MQPLNLNLDDLAVETFDPTDPANEPAQVMIVSTDNLIDCGTKMSGQPYFAAAFVD